MKPYGLTRVQSTVILHMLFLYVHRNDDAHHHGVTQVTHRGSPHVNVMHTTSNAVQNKLRCTALAHGNSHPVRSRPPKRCRSRLLRRRAAWAAGAGNGSPGRRGRRCLRPCGACPTAERCWQIPCGDRYAHNNRWRCLGIKNTV